MLNLNNLIKNNFNKNLNKDLMKKKIKDKKKVKVDGKIMRSNRMLIILKMRENKINKMKNNEI